MTRKAWVLLIVAAILAASLIVSGAIGAPNANAAEVGAETGTLSATTFTATADRLASRTGGTCWYWRHTWQQVNPFGRVQYRPFYEWHACESRGGSVLVSYSAFCDNSGGYWIYKGCSKSRLPTSLPAPQVFIRATWRYQYCAPVSGILVCKSKTALLEGTVNHNGVISGTFYPEA